MQRVLASRSSLRGTNFRAVVATLVAGAGWLVRSFENLRTTDPGFASEGRLVFDVSAIGPKFRDNAAFTDLLGRLRGYGAAQRRAELAIRLALVATPGNVFRLVLDRGRMLAAIGAAIGLVAAYVGGRIVSSQLYDVRASDPLILGAATALVVVISLLATWIPAYRAGRVDPARVLWPD